MALKDPEKKPIRADQLTELDADALRTELGRLREAQFRLKFRSATETVENPIQFRILRRNIARLETALRERKQA